MTRKPILELALPPGDPFIGQLSWEAQRRIKADLARYEKDHGIKLDLDPETGDYMALSERVSHVLPELYTNNPKARVRLKIIQEKTG